MGAFENWLASNPSSDRAAAEDAWNAGVDHAIEAVANNTDGMSSQLMEAMRSLMVTPETDRPKCPQCGCPEKIRAREPNGDSICEMGHVVPSRLFT